MVVLSRRFKMKINKSLKNVLRDTIRFLLPVEYYIKLRFFLTHGYFCDLRNPKSWNEKIQYRKLNCDPNEFSSLVDKYTVRNFVSKSIGDNYLIPILKVLPSITPSDFDDLPNSFVIKTSNGGGGENVLIVEDKSTLDLASLCDKFNGYLKVNIGSKIDEHYYDIETPKIIFEELKKHRDGSYPSDYKIHIFNGVEEKIIVQVDSDRFGNHKRSLFNVDGSKLNFDIQPKYDHIEHGYKFPEKFSTLIELAKQLASGFKYVRVDMYNIDGKVYFGELTFCHGSGWEPVKPRSADYLLGSYWEEYI